ncbi:retrovirus-related pol polyprotein from transposon TNT 1-94 [Tanacetum coccineum]
MNMALVLMAKAFKLNYSTPTNKNQRISSNPHNRQIAQPGMNMGQDRQIQMIRGHGGNQVGQYARQIARNQNRYNAVQNVKNQVVQNAVQNPRVQNVGNQNGLIVVLVIAPPIANQNANQNGNGNVVAARDEGDIDEIEDVNANNVLMANFSKHRHREEQYTKLLEPISELHQVQQNDSNVIPDNSSTKQSGETVDQNPSTAKEIRAHFESLYNNLATEVERVNMVNRKMRETNVDLTTKLARYKKATKFVRDFKSLAKEADDSLDKIKVLEIENDLENSVDNTAKTRRPQPRSNTKNDRVPSASKSSGMKNKEVDVEEHHRNLLLSKNKRHISSECCPNLFMVHRLRSKEEAPKVIKTFLKKITVLLLALVIIVRTDSDIEFKNQLLQEYFKCVSISHQALVVRTPQQNGVAEAISTVATLRMIEKILKSLMQKVILDFSLATLQTPVLTDLGLDLTYALSTITSPKPTEHDLDLLFEAMYDDYIGGQPSAATRTSPAAQAHQVLQSPTTTTTTADTALTPTNSSSQAADIPNSSQDVDELETRPKNS